MKNIRTESLSLAAALAMLFTFLVGVRETVAEDSKGASPVPPKDIGIEFVAIPGGEFQMGSEEMAQEERPIHHVQISPFFISRSEVTVDQFRRFVEATGYQTDAEKDWRCAAYPDDSVIANWRNPGFRQDDTHPVVCVRLRDAKAFAEWAGYRLPTEAEWEYAAGGGRVHQKWAGTDNETELGEFAWYDMNSRPPGTRPVCQKRTNIFGLCDMSGNVDEWVSDWLDDYPQGDQVDPTGPPAGEWQLVRGGSWFGETYYARIAHRSGRRLIWSRPSVTIGFRVASSRPIPRADGK